MSLAILNLPSALDLLEQSGKVSTSAAPLRDRLPYILSGAAVNEINDIIIAAAGLKSASPAMMAWAIMMNRLREVALDTRESREARQSIRASDRYGIADSSDIEGAERFSPVRSFSSLSRRSSTGSDTSQQSTLLEDIYDIVASAIVDQGDPIAFLANNAASNGSVFEVTMAIAVEYCTPYGFEHNGKAGQNMRRVLLDLIRASAGLVDYSPLFLTATLAVLTGSERYWEALDRSTEANRNEPAATFLQDQALTQRLYVISMLHFPYESLPFLKLCRALSFANDGQDQGGPALWTVLEDVDNFTSPLPSKDFRAYKPTAMQEEENLIELTEDLNVPIAPDSRESSQKWNTMPRALSKANQSCFFHHIPSGTSGKLLNDDRPFIVAWHQSYSLLAYMGKVLQGASSSGDLGGISNPLVSAEIVGEIIGLITNMISTITRPPYDNRVSVEANESAHLVLAQAADGLGRNQDIISVIFDVFEKQLYKIPKTSEDFESLEILVQCIHFTFALLRIVPDRVWPFLSRSGLFGIGQDESQLKSIVATQEMTIGRFDFLLGCVRIFDALVTDAVVHAISRKTPIKTLARFGSLNTVGAGVSQITMTKVLLSLTRIMIEIFEGTMKWKFIEQEERMEINFRIALTFRRILEYRFGVGDRPTNPEKLTSAIAPAADYIVDIFLSRSNTEVTTLPLVHILGEGTMTRAPTLPVRGFRYWTAQVKETLKLSTTLIRVNRLLQRSSSHLEDCLFRAAPTLAKVYAAHESYRLPVVKLFDSLVRSAAENSQQPPSLLGHLGQRASRHFLEVLSMFDQPASNNELSTAIWSLLSAVVSSRQQWFAIFLLTGTTPRESFREKGGSEAPPARQSEPILNIALDTLSNIEKLEPQKALSMLEFVALAADFWPWVLGSIEKHGRFLRSISEYAAHIGSMAATSREKSYKTSAGYNSLQIASVVADVLSMYTHYTQQIGNQKFAKMLVPHLTYLIKNAISTPSYNTSLHANLKHNFEIRFPSCNLADFKRTGLNKATFGESFFYDLELADQLLSYEPAWAGKKGNDGFAEEVRRANFNLSVVEAQIVRQLIDLERCLR